MNAEAQESVAVYERSNKTLKDLNYTFVFQYTLNSSILKIIVPR